MARPSPVMQKIDKTNPTAKTAVSLNLNFRHRKNDPREPGSVLRQHNRWTSTRDTRPRDLQNRKPHPVFSLGS
jgi:hypothetical protein